MADNRNVTRNGSGGAGKRTSRPPSRTQHKQGNQQKTKSSNASSKGIEKSPYRDEVILLVTLVFSILLALSNFNLCGDIFGPFVRKIFFGLFGFLSYLLPVLLFLGVAFAISNQGNKAAMIKLYSAIAVFSIFTALFQIIGQGYDGSVKLLQYYTMSAENKFGGGLLGGFLVHVLCTVFGVIGTYVILLAALALLFMFITEKLLFAGLSKKSVKTVKHIQEKRRVYQEERELAYEKGELPRRKAKTVTFPKKAKTTAIPKEEERSSEKQPGAPVAGEEPALEEPQDISMKPSEEELPVYEEELLHKFKSDSSVFLEEIPIQIESSYLKPLHIDESTEETEPNIQDSVKGEGNLEEQEIQEPLEPKEADEAEPVALDYLEEQRIDSNQKETAGEFDIQKDSYKEPDIGDNIWDSQEDKPEEGKEVSPQPLFSDQKQAEEEKPGESRPIYNKNDRIASDKIVSEKANMEAMVKKNMEAPVKKKAYEFPSLDLLKRTENSNKGMSDTELRTTAMKLQKTLESFGVHVTITNVSCGPAVTRYELQPEQGVKVSKITGLSDDIKLNLAAADIRIEAPIPGKAAVGIEVPNQEISMVGLRGLLESGEFQKHSSNIAFAVGKDIGGQTVVTDIGKMPHLLIAGATGSGKSVCINTLIMSILYKADPEDVKLIMVDPKVVELSVYNGIPHLLIPVVTDPKKASAALNWAVAEMTERYKRFADFGVRDLKGYNEKVRKLNGEDAEMNPKMPQIVIIVDELADLMMVAPGEVEESICRLAQLARAAGIHLIIATQRPSVNVITGVIKANVPSRIAFSVSSAVDSRTIIDGAGAEKLLGKGDMLFFPSGIPKPIRVQGAFVSDKEVSDVVEFLTSKNTESPYDHSINDKISNSAAAEAPAVQQGNDRDEYFTEAGRFIIEKDKASIGMLQRVYKIGFNRAARIMDQLCEAGVVGQEEGTKPRKVLMTMEEFEQSLAGGKNP